MDLTADEPSFATTGAGESVVVDTSRDDDRVDDRTRRARAVARVARFGWVGRGVGYVLVGYVVVRLTTGLIEEDADQRGALELAARAPGGRILLVAIAAGFVLFAIWESIRLVRGGVPDIPNLGQAYDATALVGTVDRVFAPIGKIVGAVLYSFLAFSAVQLALGVGHDSPSWTAERVSAWALARPFGRLLVAGAGVVVLLIALRRALRVANDADDGVLEELYGNQPGRRLRTVLGWLGRAGEAARGVAFVLIGGLLVLAGWRGTPSEAGGLDFALRRAADHPYGFYLVLAVGIGLIAYGLFSAASAPFRSLPFPTIR